MHKIKPLFIERFLGPIMIRMMVCLILPLAVPLKAAATISFEDVSQPAGVYHLYPTAASAWGDVNSDGWPDLWVSNHHMREPSLYLNQRDGTFVEIAATAVMGVPRADFHGAAWADFDNDGDQDLIVLSGGGAGRGIASNFLFVNRDGKLGDEAKRLGVDYPFGRGRTPLWLDADRDGKLDLLVMNRFRAGGKAPSAIFLQTPNGFTGSNEKFGFVPSGNRTKFEKIGDLFNNAINFRMRKGPGAINPAEVFAQLSDITGDGAINLLAYVKPMRVYSMSTIPFDEITNNIIVSSTRSVQDVAVGDFNGDGRMDMFLARSSSTSDVAQINPFQLLGFVKNGNAMEPNEIRFRSNGEVSFAMQAPWHDPTDPRNNAPPVLPGRMDPIPADGRLLTLSPDDPSIQQDVALPNRSISISYDTSTQAWKVRISYPEINFRVFATKPIEQIETRGFTASKGEMPDALLLNGRDGLRVSSTAGFSGRDTVCGSVAAGDFDNDMDIDLYLVCREPTQNISNILYQNDGAGHFVEVADAGGASGSDEGRGNQVSMCDYDKDGFLDLFITNGYGPPPFSEGPHQLFHNNGNDNHWLQIDLRGTASNRDGIGAIVELEVGDVEQRRVQDGGMHSFSQNFQRIHFGLGQHLKADKLTIRWPSGIVQELMEIAADQILTVTESDAERGVRK